MAIATVIGMLLWDWLIGFGKSTENMRVLMIMFLAWSMLMIGDGEKI